MGQLGTDCASSDAVYPRGHCLDEPAAPREERSHADEHSPAARRWIAARRCPALELPEQRCALVLPGCWHTGQSVAFLARNSTDAAQRCHAREFPEQRCDLVLRGCWRTNHSAAFRGQHSRAAALLGFGFLVAGSVKADSRTTDSLRRDSPDGKILPQHAPASLRG